MACSLSVPFWPTSYDNVHWSKDNRIAVLGGEHILIISPRLQEPTPGRLWWDTENLIRINAFTAAEIPRAAILTDRNTSIGEELSVYHAHAAAWSPSGLAKYGDCGLAVLTTNHVLSIWSSEAEAKGTLAWKRTVVVNRAVRRFYQALARDRPESREDEHERHERLQIQQRVRAFTWTQPIYSNLERPYPALFAGSQHLVIATEGGHLLLVHVSSPHNNRLAREQSWSAAVVDSLAITHATRLSEGTESPPSTVPLPKPYATEYVGADHVAVGEWQRDKRVDEHFAAFVFIVKGKSFSTLLRHGAEAVPSFAPPDAVQWHFHAHADMTGPLRVTPGIGTACGSVSAFGIDSVLHGQLVLDAKKQTLAIEAQSHHLDDRWDDVSGSMITRGSHGKACLHIISHLSSSTAPTCAIRIPLATNTDAVGQPAWHFALSNSKAAYGATYDLGDHVQERTWGIASAPIGGYTATCASMHPNDVVAYIIAAEQTSTLNITLESDTNLHPSELSPGALGVFTGLPSSTILFFLKRYLDRKAEENADVRENHGNFVDPVRYLLSAEQYAADPGPNSASDTSEKLHCKTKISIFANRDVRQAQATRICDVAAGVTRLRAECMTTIIRHISEALFMIEGTLIEFDALSVNMRRIYDIAMSNLDANRTLGSLEPSARGWSEECKICHQSIAFESFKWARCKQGHQFRRCALSLLAIQEPGTTKKCGVCNLQYLDETAVADFMPANQISRVGDATAQSTTTLASLLFAVCDVCIYCGGRFKD